MNALAHCVEAAYSPHRTPEAEADRAGGRAARSPRRCPGSWPTRDDAGRRGRRCSRARRSPGAACRTPAMGVHHGLAQLVGGRTGIPHGLANAILLPHAIRFNAAAVPDEVARLGAALGARRRRQAIDAPARRARPARPPVRGGRRGADLEAVARLSQSNGNVARNPRPVSEADALAILRAPGSRTPATCGDAHRFSARQVHKLRL